MKGSVGKANELSKTYENSFIPLQFKNPSNPEIHYKTTEKEIYKSTNKKLIFLLQVLVLEVQFQVL